MLAQNILLVFLGPVALVYGTVNTEWQIARLPTHMVQESDFKLVDIPAVGPLEDGEVQFHTEYVSIDASNRIWTDGGPEVHKGWEAFKGINMEVGGTMMTYNAILNVVPSTHPDYSVGDYAKAGGLIKADFKGKPEDFNARKINLIPSVPIQRHLDILGMSTGVSAWLSIKNTRLPKGDETVFISAAAGAAGLIAGQIFKIHGCTIIGSAGTDEKVKLLKSYGYDHAFNYKKEDTAAALAKFAPAGIDIYHESVGGKTLEQVIPNMKKYGTIIAFGMISQYNLPADQKYGVKTLEFIIDKALTVQGFVILDWVQQFGEAEAQLGQWLAEGKLKTEETVFPWEHYGKAQVALQTGGNVGKTLVRGPLTRQEL